MNPGTHATYTCCVICFSSVLASQDLFKNTLCEVKLSHQSVAPVHDGRAVFFFFFSHASSVIPVQRFCALGPWLRTSTALFSPRRLSFEVQHKRCWDPHDACKTEKVFFSPPGQPLWALADATVLVNESGWVTNLERLCDVCASTWSLAPEPLGRDWLRSKECSLLFISPALLCSRRSRGSGAIQGEASSHTDRRHGQGTAKTADCPWMKKPRGNTEPLFPTRMVSPAPARHNTRSHTRWLAPWPPSKLQRSFIFL